MNFKNLFYKLLLTILLAVFFTTPLNVFAAIEFNFLNFDETDDYQTLSELESKRILEKFPQKIFKDWTSLKVSENYNTMETTTLSLLKEIIRCDLFNYIFSDLPVDISVNIARHTIELAKLIGTEDTGGLIGKFEKETVNLAVKYAKEYLFANQLKVSFGSMKVEYGKGENKTDTQFQYIMIYKPINDKQGRVVARIYSPEEITPPESRGSIGMAKGFLNDLPEGKNISPFIVEISGIIEKTDLRDYIWTENPLITVNFPENVPDFGLRPKTWQEKYILNPIKKVVEDVSGFLSFLFPQGEITEYVLKADEEKEEAIKEEVKEMEQGKTVEEKVKQEQQVKQEEKEEEIKPEIVVEEEKVKEEKLEQILECSKSSQLSSFKSIIINEIAWMGTSTSSNDEWIELKNVSNENIDLKDFRLTDKGDQINIVFESLIVPKGGFVLLERTDDSTIPFLSADVIYSGSLSNNNEDLYLFDSKCNLLDAASASPDWGGGDNAEKRTMERMSDYSWGTYSLSGNQGIFGTPKQENSDGKKADSNQMQFASVSSVDSVAGPIEQISYCSQTNLGVPAHSPIIINEIAWMGTDASSSDEWIELRNLTAEPINLNNWQLLDKENQIKIIFNSEDIVPANGYYLLERTDDTTVLNIAGDNIYTGALSDTNESLRLFNQSCFFIDEAMANPDWEKGDKTNKKTMERTNSLSWQTYRLNFADETNGLYGTPKKDNSFIENEEQEENQEEQEEDLRYGDILITEVQINALDGDEYVEIYNKGEDEISLCSDPDNDCYHLAYYSSNNNWDNPNHLWELEEGEIIGANEYYLIDIYRNNGGDLKVAEYEAPQISNFSGSIVLFSNNPVYSGEEEKTEDELILHANDLKVDAIGWKRQESDEGPLVKEGEAFIVGDILNNEVLGRKWYSTYADTNNNLSDFRLENSSIRNHVLQPPDAISTLAIQQDETQINSFLLTWDIPNDPDSEKESLTYDIYYSKGNEIDEDDLVDIETYVNPIEEAIEGDSKKFIIPDLYFGSTYYFMVKASDNDGNHSFSNKVVLATDEVVHQKQAPYIDFARSNRTTLAGITTATAGESLIFVESGDGNNENDSLYTTHVIDVNGTVYFMGRIDNEYGAFAYNKNGTRKWRYACDAQCDGFGTLGNDGTFYYERENTLYAITPSGKLKWSQEFAYLYSRTLVMDVSGLLYIIASTEAGSPKLFVIDDSGNIYNRNVLFDIKAYLDINPVGFFSEIAIDSSGYLYFAHDRTILKCKLGEGLIAERTIDYKENENYNGREMSGRIEEIYISSNGENIFFSFYQGGCCTNNVIFNIIYSMTSDLNTINWEKDVLYRDPIGINKDEIYFSLSENWNTTIYAVNISDGVVKWTKEWLGIGSPSPQVSKVVSTSQNRIYFIHHNLVLGYDINNITDTDPTHDLIYYFDGAISGTSYSVTFSDDYMYISQRYKISRVSILP